MSSFVVKNKVLIIMLLSALGAQELLAMHKALGQGRNIARFGTRSFVKSTALRHLESRRLSLRNESNDFLQELLEMRGVSIQTNTQLLKYALLNEDYMLASKANTLVKNFRAPIAQEETTILLDLALQNKFFDIAESLVHEGALLEPFFIKYASDKEIQTFLFQQSSKTWKE